MNEVTVLVVEDYEGMKKNLKRLLKRYGCVVDTASSYEEAEQFLDRNQYDMVTLDMALSPDEEVSGVSISSGWDFLVEKLSQESPTTNIYVISASFNNDPSRAFQLRNYEVRGFMPKGQNFDPQILKEWVENTRSRKTSNLATNADADSQKKDIPAKLFTQLRTFFQNSGDFGSKQQLITLFADERLRGWQHQLPNANSTLERVEGTIYFLYEQENDAQQNGLCVLLTVMGERLSKGDAAYGEVEEFLRVLAGLV